VTTITTFKYAYLPPQTHWIIIVNCQWKETFRGHFYIFNDNYKINYSYP